jgi:hypothetical protein
VRMTVFRKTLPRERVYIHSSTLQFVVFDYQSSSSRTREVHINQELPNFLWKEKHVRERVAFFENLPSMVSDR